MQDYIWVWKSVSHEIKSFSDVQNLLISWKIIITWLWELYSLGWKWLHTISYTLYVQLPNGRTPTLMLLTTAIPIQQFSCQSKTLVGLQVGHQYTCRCYKVLRTVIMWPWWKWLHIISSYLYVQLPNGRTPPIMLLTTAMSITRVIQQEILL